MYYVFKHDVLGRIGRLFVRYEGVNNLHVEAEMEEDRGNIVKERMLQRVVEAFEQKSWMCVHNWFGFIFKKRLKTEWKKVIRVGNHLFPFCCFYCVKKQIRSLIAGVRLRFRLSKRNGCMHVKIHHIVKNERKIFSI